MKNDYRHAGDVGPNGDVQISNLQGFAASTTAACVYILDLNYKVRCTATASCERCAVLMQGGAHRHRDTKIRERCTVITQPSEKLV